MPSPDEIAKASHSIYNSLPRRGKPLVRSNGQPEWTVLACFAFVNETDDSIRIISLGTGVKCLPANRLPLYGDVLHDSHAEIIARRGFLLWLYDEIARFKAGSSDYLQKSGDLLEVKPEYKLHVYVSTLPCGDASTIYLSRIQDPEVAAGFGDINTATTSTALARGRQGFLHLGALRTKPARADAILTESLSCSDKLASYSYLGIQGALLAKLIKPIYISGYVFGSVAPDLQPEIMIECRRALFDRLGSLPDSGIFSLHESSIAFTDDNFVHSKERVSSVTQLAPASAAESISWIQGQPVEVLLNGIKQGNAVAKSGPHKPAAQSRICRMALFSRFMQVQGNRDIEATYGHRKDASTEYQAAKRVLRSEECSPFRAWLVSSSTLQAFDSRGTRSEQ